MKFPGSTHAYLFTFLTSLICKFNFCKKLKFHEIEWLILKSFTIPLSALNAWLSSLLINTMLTFWVLIGFIGMQIDHGFSSTSLFLHPTHPPPPFFFTILNMMTVYMIAQPICWVFLISIFVTQDDVFC